MNRLSRLTRAAIVLATLPVSHLALAVPIAVDFEAFTDGQFLTTEVAGLTFSNARVLSAGGNLNDVDFPPHSGTNVAFDAGGPLTIDFASPLDSFAAYFTYTTTLTLTAYDSALAPIASVVSAFGSNFVNGGAPGSAPNELLQIVALGSISRITIAGAPSGGSFVVDDLLTVPASFTSVPEPGIFALLITGLALLALPRRRRAERR